MFGIAIFHRQLMSILLLAAQFTIIEGYASFCKANKTLTIPAGSSTLFEIDFDPGSEYRYMRYTRLSLKKTSFPSEYIVDCFLTRLTFTSNFTTYDCSYQFFGRTEVNGYMSENDTCNINIELKDTRISDNGTYTFGGRYSGGEYCWILHVIDLKQVPGGRINENEPVRIFGNPVKSLLIRPFINATAKWLLNGINVNESASTLEQDNALWIASVPRTLNGKNVTYRLEHDDGQVNEVHLSLEINYGPDWPLILSPPRTYYTLNSGEYLPNISCNADCNPPCKVVWLLHSDDNVLRLGHVTPNSTGEYTCEASTPRQSVTTTIYVNVIGTKTVKPDNTSHIAVGLAVVASVQAITSLILGVCGIWYCLRTRKSACSTWCDNSVVVNGSRQKSLKSPSPGGSKSKESKQGPTPMAKKGECTESENYEDLDERSKYVSAGSHLYSRATEDRTGCKMDIYENTQI